MVMTEQEDAERDVESELDAIKVAPLSDLVPQSEPWLRARKLGLGGSDAAAVLGLGEWASPFEVWLDKRQRHPDGLSIPENRAMSWGKRLEAPLADAAAEITGCTFVTPTYLYQHRDPGLSFMLANPDRFAIDPARPDPGIVELKTCSHWMADRWGEDDPATYALLQAVHYMVVLQLKWAIIAVLIAGQDDRYYRVELDPEMASMLIEYEASFWDAVLRDDPPAPTGSAEDTDLLTRLWSAVGEKKVIVDDDAMEIARQYNAARKAEKEAERAKNTAGNALRFLMEDASEAVTASGVTVATWREHETSKFRLKEFQATSPHLAATYTRKEPQRTLRVKDL